MIVPMDKVSLVVMDKEKQAALEELGPDFKPDYFDRETCNQVLNSIFSVHGSVQNDSMGR